MKKIILMFLAFQAFTSVAFASDDYAQLETGYHDGFYLRTPDEKFSLKIGSRINFGYTYGFLDNAENLSSFDIQHAKFYIGGNAYGPHLQYYVQAAAANNTRTVGFGPYSETNTQGFTLEDYYVRVAYEGIDIKFGQFKIPFGRQWMIYSGNLDFVQRSLATQAFLLGRDRGVSLNRYTDTAGATVGVFNGGGFIQSPNPFQVQTAQNQSNDTVHKGLLYVARVTYSPFGSAGYSEGDVEQTQDSKLDVGGGFAYDQHRDYDFNLDRVVDDTDVNTLSASSDLTWKNDGKSLQGEFFYRRHQPSLSTNFTAMGFYVQPAYFFTPRKVEGAVRFSWLDPNTSLQNNRLIEASAILNYYISEDHRVKAQLQYSLLHQDQPARRIMSQFIDLSFQVTI